MYQTLSFTSRQFGLFKLELLFLEYKNFIASPVHGSCVMATSTKVCLKQNKNNLIAVLNITLYVQ